MDLRPVLYVIGILLFTLALSMIFPMTADLMTGHEDWKVFFLCIIFTAFFGGALVLTNSGQKFTLGVRQVFLLTTLSWVALSIFAAVPFAMSGLGITLTDALFEAVSGITTTGSTILTGLDSAPPGILLWRSILQWLGGIGIIVMALSVLPFLKVGGMQLFRAESSEDEKAMPRAAQLAGAIALIYLFLTFVCLVFYHLTGMDLFDALTHAMTTIATGGFSTHDASFSYFENHWTKIVAIIFMLMGGFPFVLYLKAVRGNVKALFTDSQVRWFLSIVACAVSALTIYLGYTGTMYGGDALLESTFNVASLITGTGYTSSSFDQWGPFAISVLFFIMVVGGCAGSTTCGIKVFRFQVLYAVALTQIKQLLHPHGVFIPHYNGKPIPKDVPVAVMSFFFLYAFCFSVLAMALSFTGLDYLTAMSGAATAISNVGPGMGEIIGPAGTFAPLPDSAKWMLCAGMLLGRLELFTVLVLFAPQFWKK